MKTLLFALVLLLLTSCSTRIKDFDTCVEALGGHTDSNCEFCDWLINEDMSKVFIEEITEVRNADGNRFYILFNINGNQFALDELTPKEFNLIIKAIK